MNDRRGGTAGGVGNLRGRGGGRVVRLEDVEALELLVQDGQRLELLGLMHLRLEPVLDFILLLHDQIQPFLYTSESKHITPFEQFLYYLA